jgi:hypothetical protein
MYMLRCIWKNGIIDCNSLLIASRAEIRVFKRLKRLRRSMGLIVIIIFREGFLLICWCSSGNIVMLLITMEVA